MTIRTSQLVPLVLALAVSTAAAAPAAGSKTRSDAVMQQAVRDFAKRDFDGKTAKAGAIKVDCVQAVEVGSTRPCSGTFSLTLAGRTARYKLTSGAGTFRNSPGSMIYHLRAVATKQARGLPSTVSFSGFPR